jgi:hypothetical protein
MRCKAVTQHMQRDVLPDPGGVDRLMEEAQEHFSRFSATAALPPVSKQ